MGPPTASGKNNPDWVRRALRAWVPPWRTPEGARSADTAATSDVVVYAVGDVHGRLDLLLQIENKIKADIRSRQPQQSILVMLGDYVDRGPSSSGVIERLTRREPICNQEVFLRGNHEQVLLDFLDDPKILEAWSNFGGLETLYAYGLKPKLPLSAETCIQLQDDFRKALPPHHLDFLAATQLSFETPTHFFVHAGIDPRRKLSAQYPEDLLWIRSTFLNSNRKFEKIVVHGHTPESAPQIRKNRIGVDTGAFATGRLTCAAIEAGSCRILST